MADQPVQLNDFGNPRFDAVARKILKNVLVKTQQFFLPGTTAQTAANYSVFFVVDRAYQIIAIAERHAAAGTAGGTVTCTVEKNSAGIGSGAGKNLLSTSFDLKAAADTNQYGSLTNVKNDLVLKKGDALYALSSGTLTSVQGVAITVYLLEI